GRRRRQEKAVIAPVATKKFLQKRRRRQARRLFKSRTAEAEGFGIGARIVSYNDSVTIGGTGSASALLGGANGHRPVYKMQ
ncbi:MAG TPA: hypothetical protein VMS87_10955, partial [Roseiarcus sp.]|nr:hypothetical protein [Roseiarcus sp.]